MTKNGRACLREQNGAIDIQYFAIRDAIEMRDVEVKHISTDEMIVDYFTKCLQGKSFLILENDFGNVDYLGTL